MTYNGGLDGGVVRGLDGGVGVLDGCIVRRLDDGPIGGLDGVLAGVLDVGLVDGLDGGVDQLVSSSFVPLPSSSSPSS